MWSRVLNRYYSITAGFIEPYVSSGVRLLNIILQLQLHRTLLQWNVLWCIVQGCPLHPSHFIAMEFLALSISICHHNWVVGDGCFDEEDAGDGGDATSGPGLQPLYEPQQLPRGSLPQPPPGTIFQVFKWDGWLSTHPQHAICKTLGIISQINPIFAAGWLNHLHLSRRMPIFH